MKNEKLIEERFLTLITPGIETLKNNAWLPGAVEHVDEQGRKFGNQVCSCSGIDIICYSSFILPIQKHR